jgi:hypothetical protein
MALYASTQTADVMLADPVAHDGHRGMITAIEQYGNVVVSAANDDSIQCWRWTSHGLEQRVRLRPSEN